jgi:hypothetical protein
MPPLRDLLCGGLIFSATLGTLAVRPTVGWAQEEPQETPPAAPAPAEGTPAAPPSNVVYAAPTPDVVLGQLTAWLAQRGVTDTAQLERFTKSWQELPAQPGAEVLLDAAVTGMAQFDPEVQALVAACEPGKIGRTAPAAGLLQRAADGAFFTQTVGLYYARALVRQQLFEEALAVLETLDPATSIDPATLLFSKGVCQHHLLQKAPGLATLGLLQKNTTGVPLRYATLATLMQYDLEAIQDNSLDEVARKMFDVERRLSLARTGEKVQKREEEIITTLDEIIKRIEEQQGGGGGAGGNSNRSSAPAQDSVIKGSTGEGKVDPKKFKNGGDWGDLPPKERSKAKDDIARRFGAHYAEAVEKFNQKQAARPARKDR